MRAFLFFYFFVFSACFFVCKPKTKIEDRRVVIFLTKEERELVLREMRELLRSVHMIIYGISMGDYDLAYLYAKSSGMEMVNKLSAVEKTLLLKLPGDFKKLGFETHKQFDELAEVIKSRENQKIMNNLANLLSGVFLAMILTAFKLKNRKLKFFVLLDFFEKND